MNNETFRLIRLYLQLNQHDFARFINVAYSTVCGIEAGNRNVSAGVQAKIARKFNPDDDFLRFVERNRKLEQEKLCQ